VRKYNDGIIGGHPGQFKTIELVRRHYWWPGMTTFINQYVKGCAVCQQMKVNTHPMRPTHQPFGSAHASHEYTYNEHLAKVSPFKLCLVHVMCGPIAVSTNCWAAIQSVKGCRTRESVRPDSRAIIASTAIRTGCETRTCLSTSC
jgi:hypothetical protein